MRKLFLLLILSILFVAAGAAVLYYYGYKDSFWIEGCGYVLVILGWLILAFLFAALHMRTFEKMKAGNNALRKLVHFFFILFYPVWLVALVAAFVMLDYAKDDRVEKILLTNHVAFTSALVVRIEERRIKSSTRIYAVIAYSAAGAKIEQAIRDDQRHYTAGQQVNIKYSLDHPDMFAVIQPPLHQYVPFR